MKTNFILFIALFLFQNSIFGQETTSTINVIIKLKFNGKDINLDEKYISKNKDTLSFETIKFYISSVQVVSDDYIENKEINNYHLIDIENQESLRFSISNKLNKQIKALNFNIGVDSLASVSGAMAGDLDVTNGMYWAWQSGFINMKIEGKSNSCKTRKNQFHFHVGGYLKPNYAMRNVNFNGNINKNEEIIIKVDLAKLFDKVDLKETNSIMIPGKEAMKIADLSTKMFTIE